MTKLYEINKDEYTQASDYHKLLLEHPDWFLGETIRMVREGEPGFDNKSIIDTTVIVVEHMGRPFYGGEYDEEPKGWEPYLIPALKEKCFLPNGTGEENQWYDYVVTHISFEAKHQWGYLASYQKGSSLMSNFKDLIRLDMRLHPFGEPGDIPSEPGEYLVAIPGENRLVAIDTFMGTLTDTMLFVAAFEELWSWDGKPVDEVDTTGWRFRKRWKYPSISELDAMVTEELP